jgi:tRNA guanosine-2'-O-methyltransferase
MYFRVAERVKYTQAYEQYANLFETVVLDRYLNQVQACLPELTRLLNSDITYIMASALLSASLNPLVQEGTRKIIGNWYIDYVVKVRGRIEGHTTFLLEGFLPWATVGELFTSSLVSTRNATICTHGTSLADVIARFVAETPGIHNPPLTVLSNSPGRKSTPSSRKCVVLGVLDFILDARGKIFHFATLYLLDGLIQGLKACRGKPVLQEPLTSVDVDKICRISRLPGLPEAASHLYAEYCFRICNLTATEETRSALPGYQQLSQQVQRLAEPVEPNTSHGSLRALSERLPSLQALRKQLEDSQHRWVQGDDYAPVCRSLIAILDSEDPASVNSADLHFVLDALWEEADRRVFIRSVAVHIPSVLFHTTCIRVLEEHQTRRAGDLPEDDLQALLSRAMLRLQQLSESRTYMLTLLATSVRRAAFSTPEIMTKLPLQEYIMRFLSHPPTIKVDFLFEVAAAEKLQQHHAHRMYSAYYGQREWMAYAAMIDLIQRIPDKQMQLAKSVLDQLLQPWKTQKAGTPIISRWKNVLQLQAMLILADYCIHASDVDAYLASFRHALDLEAWPRYRFLLEWIIARIYYRFPEKTPGLLEDLANVDDHSGLQIASLMKLALLVAPRESEDFSTTFMTQLVPFSASSKVQIRHESNYAVPIIFGLAVSKGWSRITENIAFVSLNAFIRGQEKFQAAPWTIRTLRLDPVKDFKLVNIFQGEYLTIESPEKDRVAYEDFQTLYEADDVANIRAPPARVPLGDPISIKPSGTIIPTPSLAVPETQSPPAFFQTKSGFDIASLHPPSGPPSLLTHRPASVILVASLIDNPTNLGGLSRISESFGMRSLYIDDLKKTAHKDFKATSVTSEKHFPIHELKVAGVPAFLIEMKREGYEVVGIEQTDRSGVLGTEGDGGRLGTLPKKCVLVLGSEKGGISAEVLAVLDRCVEIRTVGVTRSLSKFECGCEMVCYAKGY